MIELIAKLIHISNGEHVYDFQRFADAEAAELYANDVVERLKLEPGVVDFTVTLTLVDDGSQLLHLCLDDDQPYYEHRMGWRDNYDVARHIHAARRRATS